MPDKSPKIALIVLAAGSSNRLGRPKQLVVFNNETLLERIVREAVKSLCSPVIVVTGKNSEAFRRNLNGFDVRVIENENWEQGMGTSVGCGISEIIKTDGDSEGAVLCVCDQPFVTAKTINNLVKAFQTGKNKIVASGYSGSLGVPALFGQSFFAELMSLDSAGGAKKIIEKYRAETIAIDFPEGAIDIDTPDDLEKLKNYSN